MRDMNIPGVDVPVVGERAPALFRPLRSMLALFGLSLSLGCSTELDRVSEGGAAVDPFARGSVAALAGRVSPEGLGSNTLNLDHGFEAVFDPGGARLYAPTRHDDSLALASLRLVGIGRGAARRAVGDGDVVHEGGRLEIRRPGIVEWFENRADGLEHGLTIALRPPGASLLSVDLDVSPATARTSLNSVVLSTPSGRSLDYSKLMVMDATGERVAARFEVPEPSRVRIVVDDRSAVYPLLIDPLVSGTIDGRIESDQIASMFGYTVASAGDVNGDGKDDVIVGAYEYDAPGSLSNSGAAFIFLGGAGGIPNLNSSAAATTLFGTAVDQYFGVSVASAGDVNGDGYDDVIVGSSFTDGQANEGAAFVFHGGPNGIANGTSANANTVLQGNQVGSGFGYSVSSAGDVNGDGRDDVIVGAPQFDTDQSGDPAPDTGAAFVFLGGPSGVVSAEAANASARLASTQLNSAFGFSVASAGDVNGDGKDDVIVAARNFTSGQTNEGAAFIFHGSPTGVAHGTNNTAATRLESDDPDGQLFDVGPAGDLNGDGYDDVVAGIPLRASTDEGAVFIYMGSASGVTSGGAAAATILVSDQYFASVGSRARTAGDVNNDGYSDLVVGASRYSSGQTSEGAVFVFLGRPGGIPGGTTGSAFVRLEADEADEAGNMLGTSVAGAGDINGDGFSDIIAGAPYLGVSDVGAAYLWTGGDVDSDGDGLMDREEGRIHHTNPFETDTDDDGFDDDVEVANGSNPLDVNDPVIRPPFTSAVLPMTSLADSRTIRVGFTTLPDRPALVIRAYPDESHPDMELAIEFQSCVLEKPWDILFPANCPIPPPHSPSLPPSVEPNAGSYPLWLCAYTWAFFDSQGGPSYPPQKGHCDVRIRPVDFGARGAPAGVSLTIRTETEVPTWTLPPTNVTTTQPVTGTLNSGTENFYNEGQSFRWIYASQIPGGAVENFAFTPIAGRCEWQPNVPPANPLFQPSYTYQFQGNPVYAGLDCCTWQVTSSTSVVGTGQAIFYLNVDGNNPANQPGDIDRDGIKDVCDNCLTLANGPLLGTCISGSRIGAPCRSVSECQGGECSREQQDNDRDRVGDACAVVPEPGLSGSLGAGLMGVYLASVHRRSRNRGCSERS